jgi:hypothetical protein
MRGSIKLPVAITRKNRFVSGIGSASLTDVVCCGEPGFCLFIISIMIFAAGFPKDLCCTYRNENPGQTVKRKYDKETLMRTGLQHIRQQITAFAILIFS